MAIALFFSTRSIPPAAQWNFESEVCRAAYSSLYARDSIDARIVFGYKDARPARFVADRYERLLFIEKILAGCAQGEFACGFRRSEKDGDLFLKSISGPDGRHREVYLRVIGSSVGPDDEENRKDPFQAWKSRTAESAFFQGLANADLVFYNGHSRAGGGPDFSPPELDASLGVAFGWYKNRQPGFSRMEDSLKHEPNFLKLLGLFSCASNRLFVKSIEAVRPGIGVMSSSKLIYFSDALENSREMLSAVLGMKCEKAFTNLTRKPEMQAAGTRISGFFEDLKPSL